jgi:hypothetical protein
MTAAIPHIRSFKVGNDELNVDELLKRDYDDIREASLKLPAAIAWLGWQRSYFSEQLYMAEVAVKAKKGELTIKYKQEGLEAAGYNVKATDSTVEAAVNIHPEVLAAQKEAAKYTRIVSNLTAYIGAFQSKIELVRTSEATHRRAVEQEPPSDEELETQAQRRQQQQEDQV